MDSRSVTRRGFLGGVLPLAATAAPPDNLVVPVHHVLDTATRPALADLQRYNAEIWPEAVRDFIRCGIQLQRTNGTGEVRRLPGGGPTFTGLVPRAINVVLTPSVPLAWDKGRALSGITTTYERHHICVVALRQAHPHQIPFLSVNTAVHELLHVLLLDVFESRPKGISAGAREFRIDTLATRLWLFHDGAEIRSSAQLYMTRLHARWP